MSPDFHDDDTFEHRDPVYMGISFNEPLETKEAVDRAMALLSSKGYRTGNYDIQYETPGDVGVNLQIDDSFYELLTKKGFLEFTDGIVTVTAEEWS